MQVKVRSYFTISIGGERPKRVHNTLSIEYIYLLQGLLKKGQSYKAPYQGYTVNFTPPSNLYFVFLNNGTVVARIPAKLSSFNESINTINTSQCQNNLTSCNLDSLSFNLEYSGTDETNDSYTFDEIQLWADNEYMIAYVNVGSITKSQNSFVRVTWEAIVTIESNGILYLPGCSNFSLMYNLQLNLNNYQPYLCLNLPYIIVALTLVPISLIPQNTFLYTQLGMLLKIINVNNIQQLQLQGVTYYVVTTSSGTSIYTMSQPYIIINQNQPPTVSLFLLYGVNNNYFIYTTSLTVTLQYFKLYIPNLIITVVEQ